LNVSSNDNLTHLGLTFNNLSTINVSQNTKLEFLHLELQNFITSIDVSANSKLRNFECSYGAIKELDLSNNTKLESVNCIFSYELTKLNLANGHNTILTIVDAFETPKLLCIQVDDQITANNGTAPYNTWLKDAIASYSENCDTTLGIDDEILNNSVTIFPNPANDILNIESKNLLLTKVEIYSILGKKVKEVNSNFSDINISSMSIGLYLTKIYSEKGIAYRKFIKN
jgi:hypothetical protein